MNQPLILLVEDDDNDVFFFQRAVKKTEWNCRLQIARDGDQAIEYLSSDGSFSDRNAHPLPSLVLLDLNLPHKHGLEVLRWIRASAMDTAVPVVILTSSIAERDI